MKIERHLPPFFQFHCPQIHVFQIRRCALHRSAQRAFNQLTTRKSSLKSGDKCGDSGHFE